MTELENMVLELIPLGEENAISRAELVKKTGLTDREVRRVISSIREEDVILARPCGGYYMPTKNDVPRLKVYVKQERHRALSILKAIKFANKYLADVERGVL